MSVCSDIIEKKFLFVFFLNCILIGGAVFGDDVAQKVDRILEEASIHSPMGPVKALAALGKPAAPILMQKLPGYQNPTIILSALGRIRDPDSVNPLLHYLETLNLKSKEDIETVHAAIQTLSEIGDSRAVPDLLKMMRDQDVEISIRLYSATALTTIGADTGKQEAQKFILSSPDIQKNLSRISPVDLDSAYFALASPEAINKLIHAIKSGMPYEQLFIIDLFAKSLTPQMIDGLFGVAEDPNYFPDVRFRALEILVKHSKSKDRVVKALNDLRKDAPEKGNDKSLVSKEHIDAMIQRLNEQSN